MDGIAIDQGNWHTEKENLFEVFIHSFESVVSLLKSEQQSIEDTSIETIMLRSLNNLLQCLYLILLAFSEDEINFSSSLSLTLFIFRTPLFIIATLLTIVMSIEQAKQIKL